MVKKINMKDFSEFKCMISPSRSITSYFYILSIFLFPTFKPEKSNYPRKLDMDPKNYSFAKTKRDLMSNPRKVLEDLINYDKDNILEDIILKVTSLMDAPYMAAEEIKSKSQALFYISIWIKAMLKYHQTLKIVNPLKIQAKEMSEKLAVMQAALAEKRVKVKAIMDNLDILTNELKILTAKAEKLAFDLREYKKKMVRAKKQIEGLKFAQKEDKINN